MDVVLTDIVLKNSIIHMPVDVRDIVVDNQIIGESRLHDGNSILALWLHLARIKGRV